MPQPKAKLEDFLHQKKKKTFEHSQQLSKNKVKDKQNTRSSIIEIIDAKPSLKMTS